MRPVFEPRPVEADVPREATSIADDLDNGETPFPLSELPNQSFVPRRNGRKPHKCRGFAWVKYGSRGVRLEAIRTPAGMCTTRSAVVRFFGAMTPPAGGGDVRQPSRTPSRAAADRRRAAKELELAGI